MPQPNPTSEQWYIIANPSAGSYSVQKRWPAIEAALQANHFEYKVVFTEKMGHAVALVEEGIRAGYRQIMGIGGDGTNHEIINGIIAQKIVPSQEITYALLPIGTGNDWVKNYNIPQNYKKWLPLIQQGKTTLQDIGLVKYYKDGQAQQRYFTNVAGMAYDGFVVQHIESNKDKVVGQLGYLWNIIKCLWLYELSKARITFNGQVIEDDFYAIAVGICRYSGGGMQFVPQAVADDGQLALTYASRMSKLSVILNTPRFYMGTIANAREITTHQTKHIKVEGIGVPVLLEADGEFLGETPVEFEILEKVLRIVVP